MHNSPSGLFWGLALCMKEASRKYSIGHIPVSEAKLTLSGEKRNSSAGADTVPG